MATINDGRHQYSAEEQNLRLTADIPGGELGWIYLKDLLKMGIVRDLGSISMGVFDSVTEVGIYKYTVAGVTGILMVSRADSEAEATMHVRQTRFETVNAMTRWGTYKNGQVTEWTWNKWESAVKETDLSKIVSDKGNIDGKDLNQYIGSGIYSAEGVDKLKNGPAGLSRGPGVLVVGSSGGYARQTLTAFYGKASVTFTRAGNGGTNWSSWEEMNGGNPVEVVQTTGQSTTAVMSQKSVTDAINGIGAEEYKVGAFVDSAGDPIDAADANMSSGVVIDPAKRLALFLKRFPGGVHDRNMGGVSKKEFERLTAERGSGRELVSYAYQKEKRATLKNLDTYFPWVNELSEVESTDDVAGTAAGVYYSPDMGYVPTLADLLAFHRLDGVSAAIGVLFGKVISIYGFPLVAIDDGTVRETSGAFYWSGHGFGKVADKGYGSGAYYFVVKRY